MKSPLESLHRFVLRCSLLLILLIHPSKALCVAPDTLWTRSYGIGAASDVVSLADGGFVATGYGFPSLSAGNPQIRLIRTDAAGDMIWSRIYGDPPYSWPYGYGMSVFAIAGGEFLLAADKHFPYERLVQLLRIDSMGDTIWTRFYGNGALTRARMLSDGGLAFLGKADGLTSSPIFLRRTDSSYNLVWSRTYSPGDGFDCSSLDETSDGGFIIAGSIRKVRYGDWDAMLIRTDASGVASWTRFYGDPGLHQFASSVRSLADGGFVFSGTNDGRLWVVRTDSNGDTLWSRTFTDRQDGNDIELAGQDIVIAATFLSPLPYPFDLDLMRLDGSGHLLWSRVIGSTEDDEGEQIAPVADGGYVAAGTWKYRGCTFSTCDAPDFWLVRFGPPDYSGVSTEDPSLPERKVSIYPNPLRGTGTITFDLRKPEIAELGLFDSNGRLLRTLRSGFFTAGRHSIALSVEGLVPGLYYVRFQSNEGAMAQKLLVKP